MPQTKSDGANLDPTTDADLAYLSSPTEFVACAEFGSLPHCAQPQRPRHAQLSELRALNQHPQSLQFHGVSLPGLVTSPRTSRDSSDRFRVTGPISKQSCLQGPILLSSASRATASRLCGPPRPSSIPSRQQTAARLGRHERDAKPERRVPQYFLTPRIDRPLDARTWTSLRQGRRAPAEQCI